MGLYQNIAINYEYHCT